MRAAPRPVDPRTVALITLAAAALYLALLCPEAYWGDSASLASRLDTVPKPFTRSYWLYKRSALALTAFGLGPALAANAASAVFGALGVGAAAAAVLRLGGGRLGAVVGAGSLAVAHTWWTMAEVAEVYTLAGLLLLTLLTLAPSEDRRGVVALGLVAGLSLNHHRMVWPAALLCVAFCARRVPEQRRALASALAIGAIPWILLCLRFPPSSLAPVPGVEPWRLWWERLLAGGHGSAAEFSASPAGIPYALARGARFTLLNFPGPALLLALPGGRWLARRDAGAAGLVGALVLAGLALPLGLRWAGDAHVYLLAAYPFVAVLAGLGAGALLPRRRALAGITGALAVLGPPALYAALAFTPAGEHLLGEEAPLERSEVLWPGRRGWARGSQWWQARSADLPRGAVVVPRWREGTVLEHLQQTEGFRPDLGVELSPARPLLLAQPERPTFVTWTPATEQVPLDVAGLDLLLQGDQAGFRRVVLREW
jgi:hypothetical protein